MFHTVSKLISSQESPGSELIHMYLHDFSITELFDKANSTILCGKGKEPSIVSCLWNLWQLYTVNYCVLTFCVKSKSAFRWHIYLHTKFFTGHTVMTWRSAVTRTLHITWTCTFVTTNSIYANGTGLRLTRMWAFLTFVNIWTCEIHFTESILTGTDVRALCIDTVGVFRTLVQKSMITLVYIEACLAKCGTNRKVSFFTT